MKQLSYKMKITYIISILLFMCCSISNAQDVEDVFTEMDEMCDGDTLPTHYNLKLQRYLYTKPYILDGDTMRQYLLPEIPI